MSIVKKVFVWICIAAAWVVAEGAVAIRWFRGLPALGKLLVLGAWIQVALLVFVFAQSYEGRVNIVHAQRTYCVEGQKARVSIVAIGSGTLAIFRNSNKEHPEMVNPERTQTIAQIQKGVDEVNRQVRIDCQKIIPDAEIWP